MAGENLNTSEYVVPLNTNLLCYNVIDKAK